MTTNYHTAWADSVTRFVAADMNDPLSDLDSAIAVRDPAICPETTTPDNTFKLLVWTGSNYRAMTRANFLTELLAAVPYDLGGSFTSAPAANETLLRLPMVRAVSFPADMTESKMIAATAATASTVFSIKKNGTQFATATFGVGGTVATFSGSLTALAIGDILTVVAPNPADATCGDLGWVFVGTRGVISPTATTTTTTTSSSSTTTTTAP